MRNFFSRAFDRKIQVELQKNSHRQPLRLISDQSELSAFPTGCLCRVLYQLVGKFNCLKGERYAKN